ncbi:hypothetical protein HDU93_007217 [Gonapodya sp. JEL0774]|nr:hypothetical protein HDU93_007217 [Gonapodya sp. JEL0774]
MGMSAPSRQLAVSLSAHSASRPSGTNLHIDHANGPGPTSCTGSSLAPALYSSCICCCACWLNPLAVPVAVAPEAPAAAAPDPPEAFDERNPNRLSAPARDCCPEAGVVGEVVRLGGDADAAEVDAGPAVGGGGGFESGREVGEDGEELDDAGAGEGVDDVGGRDDGEVVSIEVDVPAEEDGEGRTVVEEVEDRTEAERTIGTVGGRVG